MIKSLFYLTKTLVASGLLCLLMTTPLFAQAANGVVGEFKPVPVTLSGRILALDAPDNRFWIDTPDGRLILALAAGAKMGYEGRSANIYRLMGEPHAQVTGTIAGNLLSATQINITTGPSTRVEPVSDIPQAQPAFSPAELAPQKNSVNSPRVEKGGPSNPKASPKVPLPPGSPGAKPATRAVLSNSTPPGKLRTLNPKPTARPRMPGAKPAP